MHRILDLIRNPSYSRTTTLLVILTIALSIPLTVFVAQKQQEIRQQAAIPEEVCTIVPKTVEKCLYPDTMPANCHPGGSMDCIAFQRLENRPDPVSAICGESEEVCTIVAKPVAPSKPTSISSQPTPQLQDTCTPNGGTCVASPDRCDAIGVPASGTCPAGGPSICCKKTTCESSGGTCVASPDRCDQRGGVPAEGTCPTGGPSICCKVPDSCGSLGGTCVTNETECEGKTCTPLKGTCDIGVCYSISSPIPPEREGQACGTGGVCLLSQDCSQANGTPIGGNCGSGVCCKLPTSTTTTTPPPGGTPAATPSTALSESECRAKSAFCSGGCTVPSKSVGTCTDGRICCQDTFSALPESPIKGTAPCSGKDPICANGTNAIKRQSDASWYCFNSNGTEFVANAICLTVSTPAVSSANTRLSFTIGLDGIGTTGDLKTSNSSGSNKDPKRPSRKLFYQVFEPGATPVKEVASGQTNDLRFDQSSGKFKTTVDLGKALPNGSYIVKVRTEGYLAKVVRRNTNYPTAEAAVAVTAGKVADVSLVNLHVGDINLDRRINVLDHDILISCWGIRPTDNRCAQDAGFRVRSDLDDDGNINEFDYNLLLREFPAPLED